MLRRDARHRFRLVISEQTADGRIDDERDEKEEREHGNERGRTEAQRCVELCCLRDRDHLNLLRWVGHLNKTCDVVYY